MTSVLLDQRKRPLENLRISVTDRCNLRCQYCMPEKSYKWLPRIDLLSFEEIQKLVGSFAKLGVKKIRLTGGEPLLRNHLDQLIGLIRKVHGIEDIAMTTNGVELERQYKKLFQAGLSRVTVSLDTLREDKFERLTGRNELRKVLRSIQALSNDGISVKINTVIMKGCNEEELVSILNFAQMVGAQVRFIEYMDVGGANQWNSSSVLPESEMLTIIGLALGGVKAIRRKDAAPAKVFVTGMGHVFGIISSVTSPFCSSCDRARLTCDGMFFTCLYGKSGLDLRALIRSGSSSKSIEDTITNRWAIREDQGAIDRAALNERGPLYSLPTLQEDPRLEMHTRGG